MIKTNNKLLPALVISLLFTFSSISLADEEKSYGEKIGMKAASAFTNMTLGWLEIPKNIINVTNAKDSNIFYGFVGGTFKGAINTVGRAAVGITDLLTFPLPTEPIAYPVFVWDNFDADTSYGPLFKLDLED